MRNNQPFPYYGGKQNLIKELLPVIDEVAHTCYCEIFVGGGTVFWNKRPSKCEVINDKNGELVNLYRIIKSKSPEFKQMLNETLHSRELYEKAKLIYKCSMFHTELERAWATYVLITQSYSNKILGGWGWTRRDNGTSENVMNMMEEFDRRFSDRIKYCQIENEDALYIIKTRDSDSTLFYADPPYVDSACGHYKGYTVDNYRELLEALKNIKGKFILSSYNTDILTEYTELCKWEKIEIQQKVSVAAKDGSTLMKIEVITTNFKSNSVKHQTLF